MTAPAALSQPADARSVEILDRVRHAFAEKGFDGASMQDLARAAGMSVGNFYRYFPSKAAIVEGLIHRDLSEIEAVFASVMGSPDPLGALRAILAERVNEDCAADGQIWAEITAAALRQAASLALPDVPLHTMNPLPNSEDFSAFTEHAPGAYALIGARSAAKGICHPHHHPHFDFDEDALLHGVRLFTAAPFVLNQPVG